MRKPAGWSDCHCGRCGEAYPRDRDRSICEECVKAIQWSKLLDGVRCDRCGGHGWICGTWCDLQRAMNGRDTVCPECHGTGTVAWKPALEDVHPDLRGEVSARAD